VASASSDNRATSALDLPSNLRHVLPGSLAKNHGAE